MTTEEENQACKRIAKAIAYGYATGYSHGNLKFTEDPKDWAERCWTSFQSEAVEVYHGH